MSTNPKNPLQQLHTLGQSVWLDYIRRDLITSGELKRLIEDDGLCGVTSNPTIFDQAIAETAFYDDSIRRLLHRNPAMPAAELFEKVAVEDIQAAADVFRPAYEQTEGRDGFVSIEVSPFLANDTAATVAEARRLWREVGRPNVMIKVPSTRAGMPAIYTLTAEGINVNITLMFSLAHYDAVTNALLGGLERAPNPRQISSVASFFVSRVDTMVDKALEKIGTPEALALRGQIAVANARLAYQRFRQVFSSERWQRLARRGARVQRPLWASTGTKNPAYSDVLYIETLVGPDTISTMPPHTLDAFRDHGRARLTIHEGVDGAREQIAALSRFGIDLNAITEQLVVDGVAAFAQSLEQLLHTLEDKRRALMTAA
jgi:transaldolase